MSLSGCERGAWLFYAPSAARSSDLHGTLRERERERARAFLWNYPYRVVHVDARS
jgi:hypothetical protein